MRFSVYLIAFSLAFGCAAPALSDPFDLTYKSVNELATFTENPASGDLTLIYDVSAQSFKKKDATNVPETLVSLATNTTLTAGTHANKTLVMGGAGTLRTFTLPAPTGTGNTYTFVVGAVNTSKYVISTDGAGTIDGGLFVNTDNASDAVIGFTPGASNDVITLNGTTFGGASIGDYIILQDIAADQYVVSGFVTASGTEATPFGDAAQ